MTMTDLKAAITIPAAAAACAALLTFQSTSPAAAASPSYSCTGRLLPTEAVICSDDTLAALDRALAALYQNKFNSVSGLQREALEAQEKQWIAVRDGCGVDKACIASAYRLRISQLGG